MGKISSFKIALFVTALMMQLAPRVSLAQATGFSNVIGTAGDFSRSNSQAALANRAVADRLYKQALADHDAAWSKFPPNVALLSKSLTQSKEAKLADDQAKEFARGAMHGIHTGGNSGDFALKKYGIASEKELDNLANGSSPYMPAAEKTLGKYGMKLSADKMSVQTPFGKLPLDMSISALEKGGRAIAGALGYNPDDVSKGISDAVKTRESIASQVMANMKNAGTTVAIAGAGAAGTGLGAAAAAQETDAKPEISGAAAGAGSHGQGGVATVNSIDNRQEELQRNRASFLASMGVQSGEPIGASHQDIFRMVHLRYQSLRSVGEFYEGDLPGFAPVKKPAVMSLAAAKTQPKAVRARGSRLPADPFNRLSKAPRPPIKFQKDKRLKVGTLSQRRACSRFLGYNRSMRFYVLIALIILLPANAHAGTKISTFMEGTLVEKSYNQWVVETKEGTYWIQLTRPLSWIRRNTGSRVSFWVKIDQITRFRPVRMSSASAKEP